MIKRKTDIRVNDLPDELHEILGSGTLYDSSCSPHARTLYCDTGYYIKSDRPGSLAREAELGRLDESSHEYMRLRERYERQERAWQKANESLEEGKIPTPKNSDIARILGIKQRKVYYCISHAKEKGVIEDYSEIFKKESEENDPKDEKR